MARVPSDILSRLSVLPTAEERRTLRHQLVAIFLGISLLNVLGAWQRVLVAADAETHVRRVVYSWDGWVWYVWLLAAPATLLLVRRARWRRGEVRHALAVTAVGSLGILLVITNLRYGLRLLPNLWLPPTEDLPLTWTAYFHTELVLLPIDLITYAGIYTLSVAYELYFQSRQRTEEVLRLQLAEAELKTELSRAQWAALARQLQPHFLFNAFNAIASLVRQNRNKAAVRMIAELGELLRLSMERIDVIEVALRQELRFVRHYLSIEQLRFGDRLRFEFDTSLEALDALVPSLILQPLVENAVKHGIARHQPAGLIKVTASREGDRLRLLVADDGPGFPAGASGEGIGLANTRRRLRSLYGSQCALEIEAAPAGGTVVRLDLPWRLSA